MAQLTVAQRIRVVLPVALAATMLTACAHLVGGTASYGGNKPSPDARVVKIADLPALIPSTDDAGALIGVSDLETLFVYSVLDSLPKGVLSDPGCNGVMTPGDETVYRGSDYEGAYGQLSRDDDARSVSSDAVAFDDSEAAGHLVTKTISQWKGCTNRVLTTTLDGPPVKWTAYGPSRSHGIDVLVRKQQDGQGYACGRGIAAQSNVVVDVLVCNPNGDVVADQAAAVANAMLDKIAK